MCDTLKVKLIHHCFLSLTSHGVRDNESLARVNGTLGFGEGLLITCNSFESIDYSLQKISLFLCLMEVQEMCI